MKYIALLLPALVAATPVTFNDLPDPRQIQFDGQAKTTGNGCPQGTVSTSISPDKTVVTFGFDVFQTYIGPGTSPADRSKNCQIFQRMKYPSGWQFAVLDSTYHGYAQLDEGVTGTFFSTYFFTEDAARTTTTQTTITGGGVWATGQVYTKNDKVLTSAYVWAPCGVTGELRVNNRIALTSTNSQASGTLTDDDATFKLSQQLNLTWRTCKK